MAKIETIVKWLKDPESKKILAPKTLTSCVYDENGNTVEGRLNEVFQSVSNGKSLIASAITDKGIATAADATFQVMATNIGKISVSGGEVSGNNFRTGISMNVILNFQEVTWNVTTDSTPSVSASFGESITTNWNGGSFIGINIFTAYPIDLTNIKSIKIKYTESAHYGDGFPFWLGITSTKYMTVVDPRYAEFDKKVSNTATGQTEITMNVSDISGQKYIYIMPIGYTCTITDLILEKNVDKRFEITEPTEKLIGSYYSTFLYKFSNGTSNYAVKAKENENPYWAIGLITNTSNYTAPVIVSDTKDYAYGISTNLQQLSSIVYSFEYNNKTYYCNGNFLGAWEWGTSITENTVPIYSIIDSNFTNNEAGWVYMAKKLLDFYFGKEEFPSES